GGARSRGQCRSARATSLSSGSAAPQSSGSSIRTARRKRKVDCLTGKLSHSSASNANASPTGIARRIVGYFAGVVGVLLLAASAFWWRGEAEWGRFEPLTPEQAFAEGSFGLELAPLKYILVASNVSATALGTSWIRRFGFLSRKTPAAGACEADAPQNLPVGFTVSNRLPGSATPLPVKFVGLSC